MGAGQQSRIYCTRLAGSKADVWHLRQHPKALALEFLDTLAKPERDNAVDFYLSDEFESDDELWRTMFVRRPEPLTREEKKAYLASVSGVSLGSDAFFPFGDNIERAAASVCLMWLSRAAPCATTM